MSRKTNAADFFHPSRQQARFVGEQLAGGVTEAELIAEGATLVARVRYTLDPEATLKSMERFVRTKAIAKAFADGDVFNAIDDGRVADVKFFRLLDGSGVQIAKLTGSDKAMTTLLDRVSGGDLKMDPPAIPEREPIKADEPKLVEIKLNGAAFQAQLVAPAASTAVAPRRPLSREERGEGLSAMGDFNPVALKDMLRVVWSSDTALMPSHRAESMITESILAATHLAHPDDEVWPAGVTVETGLGEALAPVKSPKALIASFNAALKGETVAPISRDELGDRFKAFREGKKAAATAATTVAAATDASAGPGL